MITQRDLDLIADDNAFNPQPPVRYTWGSWVVGIGFVVLFAAFFVFGVI